MKKKSQAQLVSVRRKSDKKETEVDKPNGVFQKVVEMDRAKSNGESLKRKG